MRDLLILICWSESLPANVIKIKPGMVSYFPSPTPSAFSSEISLHKRLIKEWPADDKRAVEVANSAVLGAMPYPRDKEDQGKQMASGGRMDGDLVRK